MSGTEVAEPTSSACPTLTAVPEPASVFFNFDDMNRRGYVDPGNQDAWDYLTKVSQVICGAASGAEIKVGMFFIRALGTMTDTELGNRPESDPEVIYKAMAWVKANRGVKVSIILEDSDITGVTPHKMIMKRLKGIADVYWCRNGCFNVNRSSKYPSAVNHEKFMTINKTIWAGDGQDHPIVLSSSGNWARSQVRNFFQETTLVYDDVTLFELFDYRFDLMAACASDKNGTKIATCKKASDFPQSSYDKHQKLSLKGSIWVDPIYRYSTDSGRGTTVSFAPVPVGTRDPYIQAFDGVDCQVDSQVRVAMYQLSLPKAKSMVDSLIRLKKRGCSVKIVLTTAAGSSYVDPKVVKLLKKKSIWAKCAPLPLHTKLIMIGPEVGNAGRVMSGTANWSVAGLRYSEEHTLTFDSRTASDTYAPNIRQVYDQYLSFWYQVAKDSKSC